MAHELTITSAGIAEMAYVGEKGWHGLGQELQRGASIEEWQGAAGMSWHVQRSMVRYYSAPGVLMKAPEREVLFRSDTFAPLGYVSPSYEIVQPKDVLEFFRDLISDAGYSLETAGTLFGGRKLWALAKVAESTVMADDKIGGYLLLSTSTDGSMKTEARETTVRVVCNNTLSMAHGEHSRKSIQIGHRSTFDPVKVKLAMGLSRENFEYFMAAARKLASVKVTNLEAAEFVRNLLRPTVPEKTFGAMLAKIVATAPARSPKGEGQILELFASSAIGGTMPGVSGTAWGLVNAVTEYVDHHASAKSSDHRADSAFFGKGDDLKTAALNQALAMV